MAPIPSLRDVYASLKHRFDGASEEVGAPSGSAASGSEENGAPPFWKRWIFSLLWLPDDAKGFIVPAVRAGSQATGVKPNVIYTTAPPFSVHLAGMILRVLTGARWIAEFRDPWTTNPWKPGYLRSAFSDWAERRLESLCVETADLLVAVSDGIARALEGTGTETPIVTIRNGIENLQATEEPPDNSEGPFEIVYTGSFYHTRDPFPFLNAVGGIVDDRSLEADDLCVRFIGPTDEYDGRSVEAYVTELHLERHVRLEGWLSPDACLHHVRRADVLLLLALDQPDQVPNKLYDYLGARRPILAIADADGETARLLEEAGGHRIVPSNDSARIRTVLEEMLAEGRRGPVGDAAVLAGWTTAAEMARLPLAVETLA